MLFVFSVSEDTRVFLGAQMSRGRIVGLVGTLLLRFGCTPWLSGDSMTLSGRSAVPLLLETCFVSLIIENFG
jgi:hypothetical protein